ncbi:hypothetical protein [Thermosipho atlanticus]|uniref:Uncharacterized protein n=1 Tax=Thermosipho atlanticus DSM 15807 TaxID=1123380 RepID=A0A1M5QQU6_9BACT|nr:hypothetical protein [Thermosipho atlanticus]SHH16159.1 hypothetical protein SAMN02745199_0075 [Thermosipho atlanticus DSM 15807]
MQKKFTKLSFSLLVLLSYTLFSESIYTGIKYTYRNTIYENYIILTSSIERKVVIFNVENKKIDFFLTNVGVYPVVSYMNEKELLVIDSVGKQVLLYNLENLQVVNKELDYKPIFYKKLDNVVYILDNNGNLYGFNFDLEIIYHHKFSSKPSYFDFYNSKAIGFYIWNKEIDIEYDNKLLNFNLITPNHMISKYVLDSRGGKILDFETKKIYTTEPYLSFGLLWNNELYFASMFTKTIYKLKNDKIYSVAKLEFQPTNGKVFNDRLYILSAHDDKLIIIGKKIEVFDTGKFPIDIFKYKDKIIVICADNGEINIFNDNQKGG